MAISQIPIFIKTSVTINTGKVRNAEIYGIYEGKHQEDYGARRAGIESTWGSEVDTTKYYPIYVWAEVTGESGILWVNNFIGQDLNRPALELYTNGEITEFSDIESDYSAGFRRAGEDFAQSIISGKQSELTGMEGREVLRLSLAVIKSAHERREVSLDEVTD